MTLESRSMDAATPTRQPVTSTVRHQPVVSTVRHQPVSSTVHHQPVVSTRHRQRVAANPVPVPRHPIVGVSSILPADVW